MEAGAAWGDWGQVGECRFPAGSATRASWRVGMQDNSSSEDTEGAAHYSVHPCTCVPMRFGWFPEPECGAHTQLAETAELRKFSEERGRALHQKEVQLRQLDDLRGRIIGERIESKREGQLLKQQAVEEEAELKQKEVAR